MSCLWIAVYVLSLSGLVCRMGVVEAGLLGCVCPRVASCLVVVAIVLWATGLSVC